MNSIILAMIVGFIVPIALKKSTPEGMDRHIEKVKQEHGKVKIKRFPKPYFRLAVTSFLWKGLIRNGLVLAVVINFLPHNKTLAIIIGLIAMSYWLITFLKHFTEFQYLQNYYQMDEEACMEILREKFPNAEKKG